MWRPTVRSDCCTDHTPTCEMFDCYKEDICAELKRLHCKHKYSFSKRRRLHELAIPKRRAFRFVPKCPCTFAKPARLEYLSNPVHTRTEQLAYPAVRRLLLFKQAYKKKLPERMNHFNRLIRLSLFTLYSRLGNYTPPKPRIPTPIWTKDEWKKHTRYLKKLSRAKKIIPVKGPHNPRMPLNKMKRFKKMALPQIRTIPEKPEWVFTKAMLNYKPSARILKIAAPRSPGTKWEPPSETTYVKPEALKYKANERIIALAKPLEKRSAASDLKDNPFTISPNALKYKANKHIKSLAEPREYENKHIRENPFAISPAALKAKPSARIIKLAEPKERIEKFKPA